MTIKLKDGKEFEHVEDMATWQKIKSLAVSVFTSTSRAAFSDEREFRADFRTASMQTLNAIAMGFEYPQDFQKRLAEAILSHIRLRCFLILSYEVGLLSEGVFDSLMRKVEEVMVLLDDLREARFTE